MSKYRRSNFTVLSMSTTNGFIINDGKQTDERRHGHTSQIKLS